VRTGRANHDGTHHIENRDFAVRSGRHVQDSTFEASVTLCATVQVRISK
jgi:hypothetical protein